MATQKLYWSDPFATTFEGAEASFGEMGGRRSIVLSRTLFYPESGGQLADTGSLSLFGRTLHVHDVQIDDEGTVHHFVTEPADDLVLSGGARGTVDAPRRRDHMVQHTAQHALSRALIDVARADTVSSRLGATSCTIDVHVDGALDDHAVARAEDLVNSVVRSDVAVRQLFPTAEELASMPLRRPPKVERDVRIIEIEGFDFSPCGGTHCTRSGQIGIVRVVGLEKYKQGWRVTFHAGRRALDDVRSKESVLSALAQDFTCGVLDLPGAVGKLRAELKARTDALATARGELVELLADRVLGTHPPDPSGTTPVVVLREHADLAMLRALGGRLCARADVVAFCAARDDDGSWAVVVQRGVTAKFDCGVWLRRVTASSGGRGGGRPERAEGRLPGGLSGDALAALARSG
jgi:alanyl-tRNA synthetase